MSYRFIRYDIEYGVAKITLNRPDVLNSFNMDMSSELQDAFRAAKDDDRIRAILLTGEGRAFCAGQDLAEAIPPDGTPGPEIKDIVAHSYNPVIRAIRNIPKPVICAVNGIAAGAGANIALCCDIVVASTEASFIQSFSKIGLIPDSGGTYFLPRLVGFQRASAMMMLAEKISAIEAAEIGMIYKCFDSNDFMNEATKLAAHVAKLPTLGLALTKEALNNSMNHTLEQQLDLELRLQDRAGKTFDYREGVKAFQEKRKPEFKGM